MLKRVAADAIEFRELYFSMDPRFRDWEHEKTIDQVWQGILSGKTDALEAGDHFRLASIIEVGITVGEVLCEMGWRFVYAPEGHRFITSDNPLVTEVSEPGSRAIHFRSGVNVPNAGACVPFDAEGCLDDAEAAVTRRHDRVRLPCP